MNGTLEIDEIMEQIDPVGEFMAISVPVLSRSLIMVRTEHLMVVYPAAMQTIGFMSINGDQNRPVSQRQNSICEALRSYPFFGRWTK